MPRLNGPLDVHFINQTFFPNDDVKDINYGRCFLWAYTAFRLYKRVELWDFEIHAFVRYEGRFYDSERPLGELDWRDLPATNWGPATYEPARRVSPKTYKKRWAPSAEDFNVVWKDVRAQVQKVVENESLVGRDQHRP